ncbi:MAG: hypothetical protein CMN28_00610 [Salinisphaeraceae bacterium]|jgi:hypothetical protein|nr:hypothetical protein [Salinisphaeraceae bacterium]
MVFSRPLIARLSGLLLLGLWLTGCALLPPPGFEIVGENARHSDRSFILSRNNRLSLYSMLGQVERGRVGVFANPAYINGSWFLLVENNTSNSDDDADEKRFHGMVALTVEADGSRFTVTPSDYDFLRDGMLQGQVSKQRGGRPIEAAELKRETATFQLTESQFIDMINAETLVVTVQGSSRSGTFGSDNQARNFQGNLYDFYQAVRADAGEG